MTTIATPAEIEAFKAKYGEDNVHLVTGDNGEEYIIRKPGRSVLDLIADKGQGENPDITGANNALIKNCVLAGDIELFEKDGDVYAAILSHIRKLVKAKKFEIKKL